MPATPSYRSIATSCQVRPARMAPVLVLTESAMEFGASPCPNAQSMLCSGPAMKPSRDMVMCQVVLLMGVETPGVGRTHRPRGRTRRRGETASRSGMVVLRADLRGRIALRVDGVPRAAELEDVVAEHLAPGVVDVEVERLPLVRHLPAAVAALYGAEQVTVDTAPGVGTALGVEGRPGFGAGAVAAGLPARVAREEIEGAVVAVEEHGPELGVPKGDARPARRPGSGRPALGSGFAAGGRFAAGVIHSAVFAGRFAVGPGRALGPGRLAVGSGRFRTRVAGSPSSFGSGFVVASTARDQGGAGDHCCEEARHVTGCDGCDMDRPSYWPFVTEVRRAGESGHRSRLRHDRRRLHAGAARGSAHRRPHPRRPRGRSHGRERRGGGPGGGEEAPPPRRRPSGSSFRPSTGPPRAGGSASTSRTPPPASSRGRSREAFPPTSWT